MALVAVKIKPGRAHDIYVLEDGGACQVRDFFDEIEMTARAEFQKLVRLIDRISEHGTIRNEQKFKLLQDKIWEFKTPGGVRLLCFFDSGRLVILTNGFKKKKDYAAEISRAVVLRGRYLAAKSSECLTFREET
jgi:hypothetical protein